MKRPATVALLLTIVGTITGTLAASSPSSAQTATESSTKDSGSMMLVLDSSGSMKEKAAGGQTKIAAAKKALGSVISSLPDEQSVGLRVYGAKVFDRTKKGACTDSQKVVDLGTDNRDQLRAAVTRYKPYGETPIGYALQQAGKDLGNDGQRTIVLVSDGEPTCSPDPCKVAADLSKDGIELKIDVVGLDVEGAARDKLRCIAEKGHGTYFDADDADSLTESLTTAQTRASRPFDLTGKPIRGTSTTADAPRITGGQYLDKIPVDGPLHYRFKRTVKGSTLHVGVAFRGGAGSAGNGLNINVTPPGEAGGCSSGSAFGNGLGARAPFHFGSASSWDSDATSACNTASTLDVSIDSTVGRDDIVGRPLQVLVYEEPPVAETRSLDAAPEQPTWQKLTPTSSPDQVVAGTSITNAPVVKDGSYRLDINPGESQVLAVPVGWGQHVEAQLDATVTRQIVQAAGVGSDIKVSFLSPMTGNDTVSLYAEEPSDWTTGALGNLRNTPVKFRTGALSHTVSYLNRSASDDAVQAAALPGVRYVQVAYNVRGDQANLPYTLTLKTFDSGSSKAPDYVTKGGLSAPNAESRLVSSTGADPATATGAKRGARSDEGDGPPWLPIGLGVAGVLAIAAATALVLRARRS